MTLIQLAMLTAFALGFLIGIATAIGVWLIADERASRRRMKALGVPTPETLQRATEAANAELRRHVRANRGF